MKIAEILKKERLDQNIGLRELARMINVSASYLSYIENNKKKPSEKVLFKIAKVLHLDFDYLMLVSGKIPNQKQVINDMLHWKRLIDSNCKLW